MFVQRLKAKYPSQLPIYIIKVLYKIYAKKSFIANVLIDNGLYKIDKKSLK